MMTLPINLLDVLKVHAVLGNGFQEVIYQRALAIEMRKAKLDFARELEIAIYYDGEEIGTGRVDFLVGNEVMVELIWKMCIWPRV